MEKPSMAVGSPVGAGKKTARHAAADGFTLSELLVTVSVAAVLLTWGVPTLMDLRAKNALVARTNELIAHLAVTRSAAIIRGQSVVICRSLDGASCAPSSAATADWSMGWIVFVNLDDDKVRDVDEPLLRVSARSPQVSVVFNQWWRVTFKPSGRAGNGSFTLCNRTGHGRRVVLYLSGRTRLDQADTPQDEDLCPSG